jgi:hypothetical protein
MTLDEHSWEVTFYLTKQAVGSEDEILHCMFCGKGHQVEWETDFRPLGTGKLITAGVCESCRLKLRCVVPPRAHGEGFVHVDDFIDDYRADPYARFVLDYFRRSAVSLHAFGPWMKEHKLFCTYSPSLASGKKAGRFRVTGASRLGDVWLSADYAREVGYELRVNVAECSAWGKDP